MNVLLVGGGGREHALAWRLAQSPGVEDLWVTPGNRGIAEELTRVRERFVGPTIGTYSHCLNMDLTDHETVLGFCEAYQIGLVVIGPEAPLVDGLADTLRDAGVPVFGPSAAAARLEGSKGFTKELCARVGIPTAAFRRVRSLDEGLVAIDAFGGAAVVKADGLAAGKGVTVATTRAEAEAALRNLFTAPGAEAVVEECLHGPEASLFVLCDGSYAVPFGTAEDHKRVSDGDTGPNTGGMGAFSPSLALTPALEEEAMRRIVRPTIDALAQDGTPFVGVLYAGLMLTDDGPKLIEYNVRFGDPECQALMMRYAGDLAALLHACATGRLAEHPAPVLSPDTALTVVIAARGYPGAPETGGAVAGIAAAEASGARVFQAGTRLDGDTLVASGGRVLGVTARAATLAEARAAAYRAVELIDFPGGFHRRDIGARGC